MHFLKRFAIGTVSLGLVLSPLACQADDDQAKQTFSNISTTKKQVDGGPGSDLSGIGRAVAAIDAVKAHAWYSAVMERAWYAGIQRIEAEKAAQAQRETQNRSQQQTSSGGSYSGNVSGSCAAMAPPGFPSYIINRESRGDPTADNGSHYGCVQLDYSYLTGDYAADWARLYDNGNGLCHWQPPNYCGG